MLDTEKILGPLTQPETEQLFEACITLLTISQVEMGLLRFYDAGDLARIAETLEQESEVQDGS